MRHGKFGFLFVCFFALSSSRGHAQLQVTEVLYDPVSDESRWEWIEVYNSGSSPFSLNGFLVDRVGDVERAALTQPNIRSRIEVDGETLSNPTSVPAGGVAVLYNGPALGYDPQRFRSAWPSIPAGAVLIGVEGWASNQLNNNPAPSDLAPSLPGRTVGFWASDSDYRLDVSDDRVASIDSTAFSFSYDNDAPWPSSGGGASIEYAEGDPLSGSSWRSAIPGQAGAAQSTETFLVGEPINGPDWGTPGVSPNGETTHLLITEVMYNPASASGSNEWEWIEIFNGTGSDIDFASTPHWFDDDDGSNLTGPNVTSGVAPADEVTVLFNASAVTIDQMRTAWQTEENPAINLIPINSWPGLNNTGDVVGLWDNVADYAADRSTGGTVSRAATGVVYDDSSPWPTDNNADSIMLRSLPRDPLLPESWGRATSLTFPPDAYEANEVFSTGAIDNSGQDIGSPGFFPGSVVDALEGDYNDDGVVDAADYTLWRDGSPLANETESLGVNDSADYNAWVANFGATSTESQAVPEPRSVLGFTLLVAQLLSKRRDRKD